jgi:hypothetical protein
MVESSGLLARLAPHFDLGEENLATEALCYVLSKSVAAREAFAHLLAPRGSALPDLMFKVQVGGPDGRPDLVGVDAGGRELVLVESKLWAGLTEAQPVGYIHRLQFGGGHVLLFLAPQARFETLWPSLIQRCKEAGLIPIVEELAGEVRSATLPGVRLCLLSWRTVLAELGRALSVSGQSDSDVAQLEGLCGRMEGAGFLPLRSEELAESLAMRIEQYCRLVDDAADRLVNTGAASLAGIKARTTGGFAPTLWFGRYLTLKGHGAMLACHTGYWATRRATLSGRAAAPRVGSTGDERVDDDGDCQCAASEPCAVSKGRVMRSSATYGMRCSERRERSGRAVRIPSS